MKINRTFRNAQVDGHHDHDFSSADESESSQAEQSEDLPKSPAASCSGIESVASAPNKFYGPPSVSKCHRLISQDICPNCHFFLEKMFLSSDPERVRFIMDEMPVKRKFLCGLVWYFGHEYECCPFLDLKQACKHCNTPGTFLKGGFHFQSQTDSNDCDCCSQCEYKDFFNKERDLGGFTEFLALITIVQDQEITLDISSFMDEFTDMTSRWRSVMEYDEQSSDSD